MSIKRPTWTVVYNIGQCVSGSSWVGTGWEFFDEELAADVRYEILDAQGCVPTKRPYHRRDGIHLGAAHTELHNLARTP